MSHTIVTSNRSGIRRTSGRGRRAHQVEERLGRYGSGLEVEFDEYTTPSSSEEEESRKLRLALHQKVVKVTNDGGDSTVPRGVMMIMDKFEYVAKQLDEMKAHVEKMRLEAADTSSMLLKRMIYVKEGMVHQSDAIFRLMEGYSQMDPQAFKDSKSNFSQFVSRHLDDIRYLLVAGFMELFSEAIHEDDVLNVFDLSRTSVIWHVFRYRLHTLFQSYHEAWESETRRGQYELYQVFSVFDGFTTDTGPDVDPVLPPSYAGPPVRVAAALAAGIPVVTSGSEARKVVRNTDLVTTEFQPLYVGPCDSKKRIKDLSPEAYNKHQLLFFLPLVIWQFNQSKNALHLVEFCLRVWKQELQLQKEMVDHIKAGGSLDYSPADLPSPTIDKSLFSAGTAFECRLGEKWRRFILGYRHQSVNAITWHDPQNPLNPQNLQGPPGRQKRKAGEDPDGSAHPERVRPRLRGSNAQDEPRSSFVTDTLATRDLTDESFGRSQGTDLHRAPTTSPPRREPSSSPTMGRSSTTSHPATSRNAPSDPRVHPGPGGTRTSATGSGLSVSVPMQGGSVRTIVIDNAEAAIQTATTHIANFERRRAACLTRFNKIRKCLTILLDENLMKLVIMGDSILRRVTEQYRFEKVDKMEALVDTITNVNDLIAQSGLAQEDPEDMDYEFELKKVLNLLYKSDNYFDKQKRDIEIAVDNCLAAKESEGGEMDKLTDNKILMAWLDELKPVPDSDAAGEQAQAPSGESTGEEGQGPVQT